MLLESSKHKLPHVPINENILTVVRNASCFESENVQPRHEKYGQKVSITRNVMIVHKCEYFTFGVFIKGLPVK